MVLGWAHANSDLDVYVVTRDAPVVEARRYVHVALDPQTVPNNTVYADGSRWDLQYWLETQIDQLFEKVAAAELNPGETRRLLSVDHIDFLYRLSVAEPVAGAAWLIERKRQLERTKIRRLLAASSFARADGLLEDASGMLASGDIASAVLAARLAFGAVVDGLNAHQGEFWPTEKWRGRKLLRAELEAPTWDEYWATETMQAFDPANGAKWVTATIEQCQALMMSLDFD